MKKVRYLKTKGCLQCKCQSKPEQIIYDYLTKNNIEFIKEYSPDENLVYKNKLRFYKDKIILKITDGQEKLFQVKN